jgi:hypothetical protein
MSAIGKSMSEVICVKIKLKPGSLKRVHAWAEEINRRKPEALTTLFAEGISIESAFLDISSDGDFLIYYMRAKNFEKAREIFRHSKHSIDAYHKQFRNDAWEEKKSLELLLDLMLPVTNSE